MKNILCFTFSFMKCRDNIEKEDISYIEQQPSFSDRK